MVFPDLLQILDMSLIGDGPNTVSESTVSRTELSEFLDPLTDLWGESSVRSSQPVIVWQANFFAELTDYAAELSEFSLPKVGARPGKPNPEMADS